MKLVLVFYSIRSYSNLVPCICKIMKKWVSDIWYKEKQKKSKKRQNPDEKDSIKKAPHSFVFHRGKVGVYVRDLVRDIRRLMEPYTATKLKVLKKNVMKDFASVAGPLGVTHMVVFSRSEIALNMRLIRLPRGPTFTFRVHNYTLNRDVISSLKKPPASGQKYFHHPLLVMNNFLTDKRHLNLTESAFQNLFPSINVNTVKLPNIQRCLMLNYSAEQDTMDLRHYSIKVAPCGVSSSVKKLLKKKLPDMSKFKDISEYFLRPAPSSDSEFDGIGENEVDLPSGMLNSKAISRVGIKLTEIGPRLTLQLIKVQDGFCDGEVLYHKFVQKTPAQRETLRKTKLAKEKLRQKRRQEQQTNVANKQGTSCDKKVRFHVESTMDMERNEDCGKEEVSAADEPMKKKIKF